MEYSIQYRNAFLFMCPLLSEFYGLLTEVPNFTQKVGKPSVGAGFHSHQAEAQPESTESQDKWIKQVESGTAHA